MQRLRAPEYTLAHQASGWSRLVTPALLLAHFSYLVGIPLSGADADARARPSPGLATALRDHHAARRARDRRRQPSRPPVHARRSRSGLGLGHHYIPTATGWSYLAVILDLFSRKVVGWSIDRQMSAGLVCDALRMALARRQPPPGLLLHSDQGCQYTSDAWQRLLGDHGIRASMSRRGNCWDNAVVERFFLSLKTERVWTLGYLPPNVYERQTAAEPPIAVSETT